MNKSILTLIIGLVLLGDLLAQNPPIVYHEIDMTNNLDTFDIKVEVRKKLSSKSTIFQFASTAPGTYQTMNIGRFVSNFKAYDKKGNEISTTKISVNQYEIAKPTKLRTITYRVAETWDTKIPEFDIYLMAGSSLEEDHALINTHTMLGYFHGMQKSEMMITLKKRKGWEAGSALEGDGVTYKADNYDHAVDSPILLGKLTYASTMVAQTKVEIFTYSQNDRISSDRLLGSMTDMLDATKQFLIDLPVNRFTFLYHFEPNPPGITGAWEHSYSSEYTLHENDFNTEEQVYAVTEIASHEFFHIVTPLNIHSEVVEMFNFITPTPSVHLWLYEGITEWASTILLYRGGSYSLEEYLNFGVRQKILIDERFDKSWNLEKIARESFTAKGAEQFSNVYYRGSLLGNLLDIRLLELSGGKYGLREVLLDLIQKYGKGKPISEETFFDDFTAMTFPEIKDIFNSYVLGNEEFPIKEYFAKLGIEISGSNRDDLVVRKMESLSPSQQKLFDAWSVNLTRTIK